MHGLFVALGPLARHVTREVIVGAVSKTAPCHVDFYATHEIAAAVLSPLPIRPTAR